MRTAIEAYFNANENDTTSLIYQRLKYSFVNTSVHTFKAV